MADPAKPIHYAEGTRRERPPLCHRLQRRATLVVVLIAAVALAAVSLRRRYQAYQAAYQAANTPAARDEAQRRATLTFDMPPDRVVYEEDPTRAARLAALPPDPRAAYIGDPHRPELPAYLPHPAGDYSMASSDGQVYAEYLPPFYRRMYMGLCPSGLVFIHGCVGQSGRPRLVHVTQGRSYGNNPALPPNADNVRDGLMLTACTSPADREFQPRHGNTKQYIFIPLGFHQVARLYAGQADPADSARVTIRYEVDGVPGTIEGRLDDHDHLVLRVVDGPAASTWRPLPHP